VIDAAAAPATAETRAARGPDGRSPRARWATIRISAFRISALLWPQRYDREPARFLLELRDWLLDDLPFDDARVRLDDERSFDDAVVRFLPDPLPLEDDCLRLDELLRPRDDELLRPRLDAFPRPLDDERSRLGVADDDESPPPGLSGSCISTYALNRARSARTARFT
jgi:hypothetical protein